MAEQHSPPIFEDSAALATWLAAGGVALDAWGVGGAKSVADLWTECILCAACTTSCPSFWAEGRYVGPAAIVQAHRFIFDSRDEAAGERLDVLADTFGVWRCRTIFNCTNACPREIKVTEAIAEVKMAITSGKV